VQRVSEGLKLTVVEERGWSFIPKCEGAEKGQLLLGDLHAQERILGEVIQSRFFP